MQDTYVGDIGDYGKYGLLREICKAPFSLSVNWYKVTPTQHGKQKDGKYTNYLSFPALYRAYDPILFDSLKQIVDVEVDRRTARIEQEQLFSAVYFSEEIGKDRTKWHEQALIQTQGTSVVFLDPDNGLETEHMHRTHGATVKHVTWEELKSYYARGQNVILYQHRPQITTKDVCIEEVMRFQRMYLHADCVRLLEFPKYTNRFYFMFLHQKDAGAFERICRSMTEKWGHNHFCREILLDTQR